MWAAAVDCRGPHADESDPSAGVYAAVRPTVTLLTPTDECPPRPSGPERSRLRPDNPAALLRQAKAAVRRELWAVGAFSLFLNLLMLVSSIYMMEVFDRVMSSGSHDTLFFLTLIALGATTVFGLLGNVRRKLLTRIGDWLERELGGPAIEASMDARLRGSGRDGGAASRALADIKTFFASESVVAFLDAPWAPVFMAAIGLLHPALGLFALVSTVLLLLCALANEALTRSGTAVASAAARRAQRLGDEFVSLAEPAAAMGMRTALLRQWHAAQQEARALALAVGDRTTALVSLVQFLRYGLQLGIMALGAWLVLDRSLTSGGMIAASVLLSRALAPVDRALPAWKAFVNARAGARSLTELFQRAPGTPARQRLPRPQGRLAVDGLTFVPAGAEVPLLRNISFALQPGEVLGIIGPSGVGKSTLAHLLVGIWRPQRGTIRLDGAALEQWDDDELGRHLGFLPQYPSLFSGSVAANIVRMGAPDPEGVVAAAELAGAHEAILRLPLGYDTVVGPQGQRLSGGEQQRIALARALYGEPALIVLDEPDAHADSAAAQHLQRAILDLKGRGATVVLVTHHLPSLRVVDRLLLLRDGEVAAFGPRDEVQAVLTGSRRNVVPMTGARLQGEPPARAVFQPPAPAPGAVGEAP
jgi:ATP-binding cassette subfamily C exporter for protease/lipase